MGERYRDKAAKNIRTVIKDKYNGNERWKWKPTFPNNPKLAKNIIK